MKVLFGGKNKMLSPRVKRKNEGNYRNKDIYCDVKKLFVEVKCMINFVFKYLLWSVFVLFSGVQLVSYSAG